MTDASLRDAYSAPLARLSGIASSFSAFWDETCSTTAAHAASGGSTGVSAGSAAAARSSTLTTGQLLAAAARELTDAMFARDSQEWKVLLDIAATGAYVHPWSLLAPMLSMRLLQVAHEMHAQDLQVTAAAAAGGTNHEAYNAENLATGAGIFQHPIAASAAALAQQPEGALARSTNAGLTLGFERVAIMLYTLSQFEQAPFTIQRICELLAYPQKHFLTLDKLLNGLDKVLAVTSTQPMQHWRTRTLPRPDMAAVSSVVRAACAVYDPSFHAHRRRGECRKDAPSDDPRDGWASSSSTTPSSTWFARGDDSQSSEQPFEHTDAHASNEADANDTRVGGDVVGTGAAMSTTAEPVATTQPPTVAQPVLLPSTTSLISLPSATGVLRPKPRSEFGPTSFANVLQGVSTTSSVLPGRDADAMSSADGKGIGAATSGRASASASGSSPPMSRGRAVLAAALSQILANGADVAGSRQASEADSADGVTSSPPSDGTLHDGSSVALYEGDNTTLLSALTALGVPPAGSSEVAVPVAASTAVWSPYERVGLAPKSPAEGASRGRATDDAGVAAGTGTHQSSQTAQHPVTEVAAEQPAASALLPSPSKRPRLREPEDENMASTPSSGAGAVTPTPAPTPPATPVLSSSSSGAVGSAVSPALTLLMEYSADDGDTAADE